jgi:hypothetical protein
MAERRMVRVTTVANPVTARILAAQLGAEGVVWQLRGGGNDGLYPVGPVELLVDADDEATAREVLAEFHDDEIEFHRAGRRSRRGRTAVAALLVAALVAATFGRLLLVLL